MITTKNAFVLGDHFCSGYHYQPVGIDPQADDLARQCCRYAVTVTLKDNQAGGGNTLSGKVNFVPVLFKQESDAKLTLRINDLHGVGIRPGFDPVLLGQVIQLLRQKQFGRSSEKSDKKQINLFDEAELEALLAELDELNAEAVIEAPAPDKLPAQKKKSVRRPLPAGLKRIEKIIDLPEDQKQSMGDDWVLIGYDKSEQLAVIPRQHYVVVTKRAKYAPVNDEVSGAEQGIRVAPRPDQIIPKSIGLRRSSPPLC